VEAGERVWVLLGGTSHESDALSRKGALNVLGMDALGGGLSSQPPPANEVTDHSKAFYFMAQSPTVDEVVYLADSVSPGRVVSDGAGRDHDDDDDDDEDDHDDDTVHDDA
jgi:hypothetical protein